MTFEPAAGAAIPGGNAEDVDPVPVERRKTAWLLLPLVLTLIAFAGCDSNGPSAGDSDDDAVDPKIEIALHVETFMQEARDRGTEEALFNPDQLVVTTQEVVTVDGTELCGYGGARENGTPEIFIAVNDGCWDVSDWDREILVFHELGHALLGRGHTDRTLPNGLRGSIMVEGRIFGLYSAARADWREYYVDELFDSETEDPAWAQQ